jgi:hypothetical protein
MDAHDESRIWSTFIEMFFDLLNLAVEFLWY